MSLDKLSTLSEKFIENYKLYFEEGSERNSYIVWFCGFVYCRWNTAPKLSQVHGQKIKDQKQKKRQKRKEKGQTTLKCGSYDNHLFFFYNQLSSLFLTGFEKYSFPKFRKLQIRCNRSLFQSYTLPILHLPILHLPILHSFIPTLFQSYTLPILNSSNPTPFQSFTLPNLHYSNPAPSNPTLFQPYILPIIHPSNPTLFQSYTITILHPSNLTLFQSHTL